MKRLKVRKGKVICSENTLGNEMYIIRSGKVRVYKTINAEQVELTKMKKDDFFGEMSLLLGGPRTASIEAMEDTELLAFTKESLLQKIKSDPRLAYQMLLVMAKRLKEADNVISDLEGQKRSLEVIYGFRPQG